MTLLHATILSFVVWMNLPQNYNKSLVAHQVGDYDTALKEWRPLAEQCNSITQYNFGFMYDNGEGVRRDNIRAHMWLISHQLMVIKMGLSGETKEKI